MDYSEASHELRNGRRVRRASWSNQGDFIYLTPSRIVPIGAWKSTSIGTRPTAQEKDKGRITLIAHLDGCIGGNRYIGIIVSDDDKKADDWEVLQ